MIEIDYNVRRSERATKPRIDVNINEVKVVLPHNSDLNPEDIVEEKQDWIREKKQKFDEYKAQAPDREFEQGEQFLYLGEEKELHFGQTDGVKVFDGKIVLPENRKDEADQVLERFFQEQAEKHIQTLLREYRDKMGVDYEDVSFRNQRTRWGSCSPKENLSFNWRLIMSPREVIEYVVVHELAHLKERNHTKKFWRVVEEHHENYKECSNWLEENAPRMIFRKEDL